MLSHFQPELQVLYLTPVYSSLISTTILRVQFPTQLYAIPVIRTTFPDTINPHPFQK